MDGEKAAEGPRVTITIITTYLANNLWTGSIGGMIMLPAKLKTFHDDLIDGVHTLERGGFCFFIFKTGKSGADISFYQSTSTYIAMSS